MKVNFQFSIIHSQLFKPMKINQYDQVWNLWLSYKDKLHGYVMKRFKDEELAKETTQEVLLKMHKSCCSDKEIKNVNSWLFQIAHNTVIDQLRQQNKIVHESVEPTQTDDSSVWQELAECVVPLIELLPEKYAVPLKMSDIDGIKQADIAAKLDIGLSAAKSRIQRARTMLKQQIIKCCAIETDKNGTPISVDIQGDC